MCSYNHTRRVLYGNFIFYFKKWKKENNFIPKRCHYSVLSLTAEKLCQRYFIHLKLSSEEIYISLAMAISLLLVAWNDEEFSFCFLNWSIWTIIFQNIFISTDCQLSSHVSGLKTVVFPKLFWFFVPFLDFFYICFRRLNLGTFSYKHHTAPQNA